MVGVRAVGVALVLGALLPAHGGAQARVVSAPGEPSLLNLTGGWARASAIGDLRDLRVGDDYIELRVWHGYSAAETQATILRREEGHWSALLARVIRCEIQVPKAVVDTASRATMRGFVAEARRNCGRTVVDVPPGARLIASDTLVVQPLAVAEAEIESAWSDAQRAGVVDLPGRVKHSREPEDGLSFFLELRRGNTYRAAEAGDVDPPESEADSRVRQIYAAVRRLIR